MAARVLTVSVQLSLAMVVSEAVGVVAVVAVLELVVPVALAWAEAVELLNQVVLQAVQVALPA